MNGVYGKDYIHCNAHERGCKVVFSVHLTYHDENLTSTQFIGSTAIAEELADMIYRTRVKHARELNSGHCLQVDIADYINEREYLDCHDA